MNLIRRNWGVIVLAALHFCIYTLTNGGRLHIVDEASLFAVTESLGLRADVDTNAIAWTQFVNSPGEVLGTFGPTGDVFSKKGPAPAFLAVPWYLGLRLLAFLNIQIGMLQGTLLWNGVVTALTGALLWLLARTMGYRERTSMTLALLFGLATIAWPYANQFFGEPLSAFALLLAFFGIVRYWRGGNWIALLAAGIGAGIAVATVTAHAVLVGMLGVYAIFALIVRLRDKSVTFGQTLVSAVAFVAPILVAGGLLLLYNQVRFGNPFDTGYHFDSGEGFTTPIWQGFWGLIFSPYRSVFLHTPLFLACIVSFVWFVRRHVIEGAVIGALSIGIVALYSMWWMWWGGYAWGPRFLVPMTPLWVLALAPALESFAFSGRVVNGSRLIANWALAVIAGLSFLVQLGAATINFVNYETMLRSDFFPTDWNNPLAFGPPAQDLGDLLLSPVFGQIRLLLTGGIAANSDNGWLMPGGEVNWTILLVGTGAILSLSWLLWRWLRQVEHPTVGAATGAADPLLAASPSLPMFGLVAFVPLLMTGAWLSGMAHDPIYGQEGMGYRGALASICTDQQTRDALVNVAPFDYHIPMNWLSPLCKGGEMPVYGYALDGMTHPETEQVLRRVLQDSSHINFVTAGVAPNDPNNTVERWLAENAFKADDVWFDDERLLHYATERALEGATLANHNLQVVDANNNAVTMVASRSPAATSAGSVVPVEIRYMLNAPAVNNLRWFVQLLSPAGVAVAQLDTGPLDNYLSFTELAVNQLRTERAGLLLPTELPTGSYQIIAGLYNPDLPGAPRLTAADGREYLALATLFVE